MTAFATYSDLSTRMQRTFTVPEQAWITALLEDAAAYMRGVIGYQVYPSTQSTYTAYPVRGRVVLPQTFVRSVDAVTQAGLAVTYTLFEDTICVACDDATTVTFTYGLSSPPADLIPINCALVSQMMLTVEAGLGLTAGGLSSVALDDYKAAFADAGAGTGLSMTDQTRDYLTKKYGRAVWLVDIR